MKPSRETDGVSDQRSTDWRCVAAFLAALSCTLTLCGCAAESPPAGAGALTFDPWREDDYRYRLAAGDEIALRFLVNPDLDATAVIGPDGRGVLPLIGARKLDGLTAEEADRTLSGAYASILRNPQVEVLVTSYAASQIYVGGEVKEPGAKPVKGRMTLAQGLIAAGGFADTARSKAVVVLREGPGDPRPRMRVIDVAAVLKGEPGEMRLEPGDVVFVPKTGIAEVDVFVKQHITDLIPVGFSYGITPRGGL